MVVPTGNISNHICSCGENLYESEDAHIVVVIAEEGHLLKVVIAGDSLPELNHAAQTDCTDDQLHQKSTNRLPIRDPVPANTTESCS